MNDLLPQFLAECREIVEEAGQTLLALERDPGDAAGIDRVFRGIHTLKGSAGIMGLLPMTTLLHAGETVLSAARARTRAVTPALIDSVLATLDQVTVWLDALERTGDLPDDAAGVAAQLAENFDDTPQPLRPAGGPPASTAGQPAWATALLAAAPGTERGVAIRYRPAPSCFFDGDDPLAIVGSIPGCLAFDVVLADAGTSLAAADPYACDMTFHVLSSGSIEELAPLFRFVSDQVTMVDIVSSQPAGSRPSEGLTDSVRRILVEQQRILTEATDMPPSAGRLAAAAEVAARAMAYGGLDAGASAVRRAVAASDMDAACQAIAAVLEGRPLPRERPVDATPMAGMREPSSATLRVDVAKVETLVGQLGELVVAKNTLAYLADRARDVPGIGVLAHDLQAQQVALGRLVSSLHETVMSIRMLPMHTVFRRFARPVRELSVSLGKPVSLQTEGEETEADKAVVESLFEPLLHLVRNAIDHGIELPDIRLAGGKAETAKITLRALREGDQLVVEVADDGRGIDPSRIRERAMERMHMPPEDIAALSDEAVIQLVFAPGFSTAETISDLSGRGVGMDAVKATVEAMGGTVAIVSSLGIGTCIRLILPMTMVMTQVLTVDAGGDRFGIPLDAIVETTRVPSEAIKPIGRGQGFVFRDRTVPVVELAGMLGLSSSSGALAGDTCIIVTEQDGEWIGLAVERFGERLDAMLRPMEGLLSGIPGVAGTTLLGNGRVLLVLDVRRLVHDY